MIDIKAMVIGGLAGAALAGVAGMQFGKSLEKAACDKRIEVLQEAAAKLIDQKDAEIVVLQVEKAQAQGEVAKVNATTRKQFEDLQLLLSADQVKREEASLKVEKAANQAARDAREAASRAQAAREVIQNVADKCASAGADPEFVRMLNGILAPS
jgi:uncharacterized protein YyaL (SSP411 family)